MCEITEDIKVVIRNIFDDSSEEDLFSDSSYEFNCDYFTEPRKKRTRIRNFLGVIDQYNEEEFWRHFRLNRNTANFCIEDLKNANVIPIHLYGRKKVCVRKAFLMTLWHLANQETYRDVSDRFDLTESASWSIIKKVVEYLVKKSPSVIKWPNAEAAIKIDNEFSKKQSIHGVIGAIDGSHILINKKGINQHAYCNRKGTHSIILQGVVDNRKRFLDVFCGEPGSLHDARVLKRSALYDKATNGDLLFHNRFLLGDSACPTNLHWLVTPFKDNGRLTRLQRAFNYKHSSTRVVVENAFALLKGRFRRLRYFEHKDTQLVVKCVTAACTLHNICIDHGETDDDIELYFDDDYSNAAVAEEYQQLQANVPEGITRRDQVCNQLNI